MAFSIFATGGFTEEPSTFDASLLVLGCMVLVAKASFNDLSTSA
jgi:hypothetical protein